MIKILPKPKRLPHILVCGGRDYWDRETFDREMVRVIRGKGWKKCVIVHGGASGADNLANLFAVRNSLFRCVYLVTSENTPQDALRSDHMRNVKIGADWLRDGKKAGILRNIRMHDETRPDVVLAFPGGNGTKHMIDYARKNGTEVILCGGTILTKNMLYPNIKRNTGLNYVSSKKPSDLQDWGAGASRFLQSARRSQESDQCA